MLRPSSREGRGEAGARPARSRHCDREPRSREPGHRLFAGPTEGTRHPRGGPLHDRPQRPVRRLMRRLLLVRHASTAAVRAAAFGADEPLGRRPAHRRGAPARAAARAARCSSRRRGARVRPPRGWTITDVVPALAECDFGTLGRPVAARGRGRGPRRRGRLDDRPRRHAPRRRVPHGAARAGARVARRAGAAGRHRDRDHPRRRRQGGGRRGARRAPERVLAHRRSPALDHRTARPRRPLDGDARERPRGAPRPAARDEHAGPRPAAAPSADGAAPATPLGVRA